MANDVSVRGRFEDGISGPLGTLRKRFDDIGGPGSSASLFGNVGAKAIAKGFDLLSTGADLAVQAIGSTVNAASNLQQSTGAIESVFGSAADKIEEFGKTADESFGLSKRAVNESAAIIGAQLQGMGFAASDAADRTILLEKRAADMAATFGGSTSDAIEAVSALLRGERDPIERYGVSLKDADVKAEILAEGLDTSTAAAQKNAVATASLELLMRSTAKTAGQFGRESDELAGAQARMQAKLENAQAAIGEKLLPAFAAMASFAADTLIPAISTVVSTLFGLAEAVTAPARAFLDFAGQIPGPWHHAAIEINADAIAVSNRMVELSRSPQAVADDSREAAKIAGVSSHSIAGSFATMAQASQTWAATTRGGADQVIAKMRGVIGAIDDLKTANHDVKTRIPELERALAKAHGDEAARIRAEIILLEALAAKAYNARQKYLNLGRALTEHGRAEGGPVFAGETYRVGERGPETLVMGGGGDGWIIPNGGGSSSSSGPGGFAVQLVGVSAAELVDVVERELLVRIRMAAPTPARV